LFVATFAAIAVIGIAVEARGNPLPAAVPLTAPPSAEATAPEAASPTPEAAHTVPEAAPSAPATRPTTAASDALPAPAPRAVRPQAHHAEVPIVAPPAVSLTASQVPVVHDSPRSVSLLLRVSYEYGGDALAKVMQLSGKTDTYLAGTSRVFSGGLFIHAAARFSLEATVGYKKLTGSYGSYSASFTRIPIDVIASLRGGGFRAGLGVTAHIAPTFSCGACMADTVLDDALGGIVQLAYGFSRGGGPGLDLGIRATKITYSGHLRNLDTGSNQLDGSCVGVFVGGWL
jgi:hypothetical protein